MDRQKGAKSMRSHYAHSRLLDLCNCTRFRDHCSGFLPSSQPLLPPSRSFEFFSVKTDLTYTASHAALAKCLELILHLPQSLL